MKPTQANAITKVQEVAGDVSKSLQSNSHPDVQEVKVVSEPDFGAQMEKLVGPYLEGLGSAFIILILLLYLMINRENMSDRLIRVFGHGKISLTTRTIEEVGQRISKYLVMFATVNSTFGLIVGLGLWAIGVKYALLWGFLAGALRFIPYAGAATAFALPLLFTIATEPGLDQAAGDRGALRRAGAGREHGAGADDLRQDDRGLGAGAAGLGDVLDLALGRDRPLAVDPDDGLPGGPGQVRAEPELLRHVPPRGGRPRAGRPVLPAAPGDGPGRRLGGDRHGPEEVPEGRGLRQGPGAHALDGRARLRPGRHR